MVCPILSACQDVVERCLRSECAFWVDESYCCCFLLIAKEIKNIRYVKDKDDYLHKRSFGE